MTQSVCYSPEFCGDKIFKRAPKHWYDKFSNTLKSLNLHSYRNVPCIFHGNLLRSKPPLYVGIYIDYFVPFSADWTLQHEFKTKLSSLTNVDFMGYTSHLLGMKFTWTQPENSSLAHLSYNPPSLATWLKKLDSMTSVSPSQNLLINGHWPFIPF